MPTVRIADPTDPTRCCPCSDQAGCGCNAGNCGLKCRTRGAFTAQLCGFPEFTDDANPASTPPRIYRRKTVKTENLDDPVQSVNSGFTQHSYPITEDCTNPCAGVWCSSFSGRFPGIDFELVVKGGIMGALQLTGTELIDGVMMAHYTAAVDAYYVGGDPYPPGHPIPLEAAIGLEGYAGRILSGQTVTIPVSNEPRVTSMQINYAGWTVITTGCITPGQPPLVTVKDVWDYTAQYDKNTCALTQSQSDKAKREIVSATCASSSSTDDDLPAKDPSEIYGEGEDTERDDDATRGLTLGTGCIANAGTSIGYDTSPSNAAHQELSDEDTIDDAIARAIVGHDWSAGKQCDPGNAGTAFITQRGDTDTEFAFRQAQFQATVKDAIPGRSYVLTIGISARAVGSGGPFTPYGEITINFTATDAVPAVTPWQDLPCEEGLETQAVSCNAVEAP